MGQLSLHFQLSYADWMPIKTITRLDCQLHLPTEKNDSKRVLDAIKTPEI